MVLWGLGMVLGGLVMVLRWLMVWWMLRPLVATVYRGRVNCRGMLVGRLWMVVRGRTLW